LWHLEKILNDGVIKTTSSNLLRPKNPYIENGAVRDVTDSYKPVVWLSSILDFDKANGCGLSGSVVDKTQVAIAVEPKLPEVFHKWTEWAEKNNIEKTWYEELKRTAPLWDTFYVVEHPIKLTEETGIIFRPDIYESTGEKTL
jgi:hypothetical protein